MPPALAEVVSEFAEMQGQDKLTLLLEFANELPPLPDDLEEAAIATPALSLIPPDDPPLKPYQPTISSPPPMAG